MARPFVNIDLNHFFDRQGISKYMDRKTNRAMARAGGFGRQTMRRSFRKRKAVSRPGMPPSSHSGELRRLTLFAYDKDAKELVVGPAKFKGKPVGSSKELPELLNEGGVRVIGNKVVTYKARPFVEPVRDKTASKLQEFMRDE